MVHKKIPFLVQQLISFVLASFSAPLHYVHAASFIGDFCSKGAAGGSYLPLGE